MFKARLLLVSVVVGLAMIAGGCGGGSSGDPDSGESTAVPRKINGAYSFDKGWCEKLDLSTLDETLDDFDGETVELDDTSYSGDAEGYVEVDNRLSALCTGGHRTSPLNLNFEVASQVYVSETAAGESIRDSTRWTVLSQLPSDSRPETVDGWEQRYVDTSEAGNGAESRVRLLGQADNLVLSLNVNYCARLAEDGTSAPCSQRQLRDFATAFADHARALHEK